MFLIRCKMNLVLGLILLAIGGAGAWAYHLHAQAPAPKSESSLKKPVETAPDNPAAKATEEKGDTLKTLMQERLKLARLEVNACEKEYKSGKVHMDAFVAASKNLLKAELELSAKRADRLAARQRHVKVIETWVKNVQSWHETGFVSQSELLTAQYQLVDAKIDLEREKAQK
jgi:hypothetical protein